jgi:hypothetical protein
MSKQKKVGGQTLTDIGLARTILEAVRRTLQNQLGDGDRYSEAIERSIAGVDAVTRSLLEQDRGDLHFAMARLIGDKDSIAMLDKLRFSLSGDESKALGAKFLGPTSVYKALVKLESLLFEHSDVSTLRQIVPNQKIAPVQFEINDNRIVVAHRKSPIHKEDSLNIEAARTELQRNGDKILSELRKSNCDRRLLEAAQELQMQFQTEINAVKIGLMNINCEMMCNAFEAELPPAIASMLKAHTRGVQMLVAQFQDWTRFVENAAEVDLDRDDIKSVKAASKDLVDELKLKPQLVDPEVP